MLSLIGNPRGSYDQDCRGVTNSRISELMRHVDFGPFQATGIAPAVESLQTIMAEIEAAHPEVHAVMGTAGMLCCRLVRGSKASISNHSWGTAIDITIEGVLDKRGDDRIQPALVEIQPVFKQHEWFWGAGFGTEDGMHFEASDQLIRRWAEDGRFGQQVVPADDGRLSFGDRSPKVEVLQRQLNLVLALDIEEDGIFGQETRAGVVEFQRANELEADGIAGPKTMAALEAATAGHNL